MNRIATALLVDDDDAFRTTMQNALRRRGVTARTAATAEEGLFVLEDGPVDLVTLDYRMPRLDGLAVVARYRRLLPVGVIVMLTGYGEIPLAVEAVRQGADTLLTKPIDPDVLLRQASDLLQRGRVAAAHHRRARTGAGREHLQARRHGARRDQGCAQGVGRRGHPRRAAPRHRPPHAAAQAQEDLLIRRGRAGGYKRVHSSCGHRSARPPTRPRRSWRLMHLPSLPIGGPLRVLAMAATGSLLAFAGSSVVLLVGRRRREAAWAAAPLAACLLSFGLGRLLPLVHPVASAAALVLATRNVMRFPSLSRALQAVGLVLWVVAMVAAARLFGR